MSSDMAVVTFTLFIIISDIRPSIRVLVMEPVLKTMGIRWCSFRQFPQHHFPNRSIGIDEFGTEYQLGYHMVNYTIGLPFSNGIPSPSC
jgi:hypothetical protein